MSCPGLISQGKRRTSTVLPSTRFPLTLRWHAPLMKKAAPEGRPCMSHEVPRRSDSRAPRSLDKAIALTVLFHVPERRERRVERLHEHLVGDQHVEHFSPCRFRHVRNLIARHHMRPNMWGKSSHRTFVGEGSIRELRLQV